MASIFKISFSQNTKCDNLVAFLKSGHILYEEIGKGLGTYVLQSAAPIIFSLGNAVLFIYRTKHKVSLMEFGSVIVKTCGWK